MLELAVLTPHKSVIFDTKLPNSKIFSLLITKIYMMYNNYAK